MSSSSQSPKRSPEPEQKQKPHKIFVTNLDIEAQTQRLQQDLREKFSKYGKLESVVVKRSYNNKYSFAFIEFREGEDATKAVSELNNSSLSGKKIKVELQDNTRRRKGGEEVRLNRNDTCYVCGKTGHFAKNCRQNRDKQEHSRERRSRSSEQRHKKKSKKRSKRSSSSESRSPKKKDKKERSRKIKKSSKSSKHRKERKYSDSDSSA